MKIRNDYLSKHSGTCMSCQKIGNTNARKHGKYNTRLYRIWTGLKFRRYKYKPVVCKEWEEYETFKEWANSSGYSKELTIQWFTAAGVTPMRLARSVWEWVFSHVFSFIW